MFAIMRKEENLEHVCLFTMYLNVKLSVFLKDISATKEVPK